VDDGSKGNVAPTFEEEMAILRERELSPGEKQFVDEINPILRRWCDGGGCHGRGTSRNQYVDRYKTTLSGKMLILDYVQRPVDDPLHMPQGQAMAQADLDALVNWLS